MTDHTPPEDNTSDTDDGSSADTKPLPNKPSETGGPQGLEPTRYGDWEQKGKCVDF